MEALLRSGLIHIVTGLAIWLLNLISHSYHQEINFSPVSELADPCWPVPFMSLIFEKEMKKEGLNLHSYIFFPPLST